jgi:GST-like protein
MIAWPWVLIAKPLGIALDPYPRVSDWRARIKQRPAVQRAVDLGKEFRCSGPPSQEARRILYAETLDEADAEPAGDGAAQ